MKKRAASAALQLVEAPAPSTLKLDLGCGLNVKESFEGVDLYGDKAKHKVDLFKFPWPFADNSVDEIHCSHFVEHIPQQNVQPQDLADWKPNGPHSLKSAGEHYLGQNMFFAFFDEVWRILKPEGWIEVIVPSGKSDRGFQDPTHCRYIVPATFFYLHRESREAMGLSHYRVKCNFGCPGVGHTMPAEEGLRSADVQAERFKTLWNVVGDYVAKLQKLP